MEFENSTKVDIMRITPLSFVFCILSFLSFAPGAHAEEWGIAFSGKILMAQDGAKQPAVFGGSANYTTNVFIRLYDSTDGAAQPKGRALWGRRITVNTRDGLFSCELRDSNGTKLNAAYERLQDAFAHLSGGTMLVGVTPFNDGNDEISPRQTLVAAPYAVHAGDALGTVGDVAVNGSVTVGSVRAPFADFNGPVVHERTVTFDSATTLRSLSLDDSTPFAATRLAVGKDVDVSTARAGDMTAGGLSANVAYVATVVASNLTLNGSARVQDLTACEEALTVEGDVLAGRLNCKDLVLGGSFDFFKWGDVVVLTNGEMSSKSYYSGTAKEGEWQVPASKGEDGMGGDLIVSLSFKVPTSGVVTEISVDGTTVAKLSCSGSANGSVWLPFQAFLRRGQKISWTGEANDLSFYFRVFKY